MNILLIGGTGFVGRHLIKALAAKKYRIYNVTRSPATDQNNETTTYISYDHPVHKLPKIDAVINLAGESLFGYWTQKKKERILHSRIKTTEKVVNMMAEMETRPPVFINASAIGFYGISEKSIFTEEVTTSGDDFLAKVVVQWEKAAKKAEELGIRTIYARFGVILGNDGALPLMSLPVKLFVGGRIGSGEQWISWIHIEDAVQLLIYCIENEKMKGPVNFTAPTPHRNKDFIKILASVLKRPIYLPTPAIFLRLVLGEMSQLITKGQHVLPKKAEENHYTFSYPTLDQALQNIFQRNR